VILDEGGCVETSRTRPSRHHRMADRGAVNIDRTASAERVDRLCHALIGGFHSPEPAFEPSSSPTVAASFDMATDHAVPRTATAEGPNIAGARDRAFIPNAVGTSSPSLELQPENPGGPTNWRRSNLKTTTVDARPRRSTSSTGRIGASRPQTLFMAPPTARTGNVEPLADGVEGAVWRRSRFEARSQH